MEIPSDYYLDSLDELKIDGWLYRTAWSSQVQTWYKEELQNPPIRFVKSRRYFRGKYRGKRFFAKQFLRPNMPNWSIKYSVEYQFQNLLLFKDVGYVPSPLFLTEDTLGMEYIEGKTIKELVLSGGLSKELANRIISQLNKYGTIIVDKLKSVGRDYDCSYNNILVKESGQIVFVDFDYADRLKSPVEVAKIIENLALGYTSFTKDGRLYSLHKAE